MFHIVDDQSAIRSVIEEILNQYGHTTFSFSSPLDYLDFVRSPKFTKPLALITDINMPEMNGYGLIGEMSGIVPDLRFIVLSGEPHIQSRHKTKACFYLQKPFCFDSLMEGIEKIFVCEASSPSCELGCRETGDHKAFGIHDWRCPRGCSVHGEGCNTRNSSGK